MLRNMYYPKRYDALFHLIPIAKTEENWRHLYIVIEPMLRKYSVIKPVECRKRFYELLSLRDNEFYKKNIKELFNLTSPEYEPINHKLYETDEELWDQIEKINYIDDLKKIQEEIYDQKTLKKQKIEEKRFLDCVKKNNDKFNEEAKTHLTHVIYERYVKNNKNIIYE